MIRAETIQNLKPLENLIEFTEAFPGLFEDELRSEFNTAIKPPLLEDLRYVPDKLPDHPFIWSTNPQKQRAAQRGYHAAIRRGEIRTAGGRYQRTGEMAAGWDADMLIGDGSIVMVVEHKAKSKRERDGLKYTTGDAQVPSHERTGWVKHSDTIQFWRKAAFESVNRVIQRLLHRHVG